MSNIDPGLATIQNQLPLPIRWLLNNFLHHSLTGIGIYLLTNHILPDTTTENSFINWASSSVLVIAGLGWSFLNKKAQANVNPV